MQTFNHNGKISEALDVLNDAAKSKKEEIQKLLTHKYKDIREALEEKFEAGQERFDEFKEAAEDAVHQGTVRAKKAVRQADKEVHRNPWKYIGIAAGSALLLGFIMGRSSDK